MLGREGRGEGQRDQTWFSNALPHSVPCLNNRLALPLQEKKQLVFEGTVGRDMEALGRLTEDDLRFLFG